MQITDLLARRTDLSTFLVHLTRATDGRTAKQNLLRIIESNTLEARSPFGTAFQALQQVRLSTDSQRCVCFTETPLEHVSLLTQPIDGRTIEFAPYGIAITRKQGRLGAVNPVWYLDMTRGHDWLTEPVKELVQAAIELEVYTGEPFDEQPIAQLAPFMDWMGVWETGKKEFWWEREWRHRGNFPLPHTAFIVLCPAADRREIEQLIERVHPNPEFCACVRIVDPTWSLEMIIGTLAGFGPDEMGPF
jgi:hypothetical protein